MIEGQRDTRALIAAALALPALTLLLYALGPLVLRAIPTHDAALRRALARRDAGWSPPGRADAAPASHPAVPAGRGPRGAALRSAPSGPLLP